MRSISKSSLLIVATIFLSVRRSCVRSSTSTAKFHNAPDSALKMKNPYEGNATAAQAGKAHIRENVCRATARLGKGTGNIPSLVGGKLESVTVGEVFWFITKGDKDNGMPSWALLPAKQRWQIVSLCNDSPMPTSKGEPAGNRESRRPTRAPLSLRLRRRRRLSPTSDTRSRARSARSR